MDMVISAVNLVFSFLYLLLILRAVLPWLTRGRIGSIDRLTDPFLNPIRLGLPPEKIGADVSPFAAIIILFLAQKFLTYLLTGSL